MDRADIYTLIALDSFEHFVNPVEDIRYLIRFLLGIDRELQESMLLQLGKDLEEYLSRHIVVIEGLISAELYTSLAMLCVEKC